jgi:hypothetical protein
MDQARNVIANFTTLPNVYTLNTTVIGVGGMQSKGYGLSSCINTVNGCSNDYLAGATEMLTVTLPTWYQLEAYWGGDCSGSISDETNNTCDLTMNSNKIVTATYVPNLTVKVVGGRTYSKLEDAYDSITAATATIQAKDSAQIVFEEVLDFNKPGLTLTIQGGKGSTFTSTNGGYTSIKGSLNVRNGKLIASNIKIKP